MSAALGWTAIALLGVALIYAAARFLGIAAVVVGCWLYDLLGGR